MIEEEAGPRVIALQADDMERFVGPPFDAENEARLTLLLLPSSLEALDSSVRRD